MPTRKQRRRREKDFRHDGRVVVTPAVPEDIFGNDAGRQVLRQVIRAECGLGDLRLARNRIAGVFDDAVGVKDQQHVPRERDHVVRGGEVWKDA